jgi:hypothetical protein
MLLCCCCCCCYCCCIKLTLSISDGIQALAAQPATDVWAASSLILSAADKQTANAWQKEEGLQLQHHYDKCNEEVALYHGTAWHGMAQPAALTAMGRRFASISKATMTLAQAQPDHWLQLSYASLCEILCWMSRDRTALCHWFSSHQQTQHHIHVSFSPFGLSLLRRDTTLIKHV